MSFEKVVFGFFVLFAATLNLGFFIGDLTDAAQHNPYQLFAAIVVSLVVTILKFGDRTQMGAIHLATSLVADVELIIAAVVWTVNNQAAPESIAPGMEAMVVSFSGGALLANLVSVVLLIAETITLRR